MWLLPTSLFAERLLIHLCTFSAEFPAGSAVECSCSCASQTRSQPWRRLTEPTTWTTSKLQRLSKQFRRRKSESLNNLQLNALRPRIPAHCSFMNRECRASAGCKGSTSGSKRSWERSSCAHPHHQKRNAALKISMGFQLI